MGCSSCGKNRSSFGGQKQNLVERPTATKNIVRNSRITNNLKTRKRPVFKRPRKRIR